MKIHIGCGKRYIPGFIHVDILDYDHIDYIGLAEDLKWFQDNSVDLIYASHILEHYPRKSIVSVLSEWYRVLKPDGVLRLSVPDFAASAKIYYEKGLNDGLNGLVGLVVGGQRDEYDYHKMIFDEPLLTKHCLMAGFRFTRLWDWRNTEHSNIDDYSQAYLPHLDKEHGQLMSLNLEAIK